MRHWDPFNKLKRYVEILRLSLSSTEYLNNTKSSQIVIIHESHTKLKKNYKTEKEK